MPTSVSVASMRLAHQGRGQGSPVSRAVPRVPPAHTHPARPRPGTGDQDAYGYLTRRTIPTSGVAWTNATAMSAETGDEAEPRIR